MTLEQYMKNNLIDEIHVKKDGKETGAKQYHIECMGKKLFLGFVVESERGFYFITKGSKAYVCNNEFEAVTKLFEFFEEDLEKTFGIKR